ERAGKKKSRLETWLKTAATPVFLVSVSRRVLFFNTGCEQLTGWTADEIVGEVVEFGSDGEPQSLRALISALCPPPEALAGRELDVPVFMPNKTGGHAAKLVRFIPIRDGHDHVTSVLGLISLLPPPPTDQSQSLSLRYHAELSALRWSLRQRYGLKTVVAKSPLMRRVLEQVGLARNSQVPVLFVGPRGVGKEHLARAIHQEAESPTGSFVPLDCRQSPFSLLQTLKRLLHPEADDVPVGGLRPRTLFLIDVEQLPRDVQERLLAEYQSDRANATRRMPLPRLISSSTELLADAVEDERLLPDLGLLLTTLTIEVPTLRERDDDFIPLAQAFLESSNRGADHQIGGFVDAVWPQLREYAWPGNLDELSLVVLEARERCTAPLIGLDDLPLRFRAGLEAQSIGPPQRSLDEPPIPPLEEHLAGIERDLIRRALKKAKRNKTLAAKLLNIQRPVLYRRMEVLGITDDE
ncbi:MAG: sigma 54-interacting transcriptional regulator, partial [Planctomycetaceae bacterium]|nr:sigma 54-interacting transcriptional regulator [Planctomycetaceae bacterium]